MKKKLPQLVEAATDFLNSEDYSKTLKTLEGKENRRLVFLKSIFLTKGEGSLLTIMDFMTNVGWYIQPLSPQQMQDLTDTIPVWISINGLDCEITAAKKKTETKTTTRAISMNWWNNLNRSKKQQYSQVLERKWQSLTGREIETIYANTMTILKNYNN